MLAVGLGVLTAAVLAAAGTAFAADATADAAAAPPSYDQVVSRGIEYLRTTGQSSDGSFSAHAGPAITAIVTTAVLRTGRSPDDPLVAKSLAYLEKFVQKDGSISGNDSHFRNYETCLAIQCFAAANRNGRYTKIIAAADRFIREMQWDQSEGHDISSPKYGGAGYGGKSNRPDLSNTTFLVDALKAAGAKADDQALKKALVFVSRCQNLETEHNTTPFASKDPDGGFYYTPAAGGSSQAGETPKGGLRSYGSMTYAGLKSMIYAGVSRDDPRVQAAYKWIQRFYDLKSNPGMGEAGLFYYYQTFAKALDAIGDENVVDSQGKQHAWRQELLAELARRQRPNGSWVNGQARWLEGDANLVTAYALLTLSYCKPTAQPAAQ